MYAELKNPRRWQLRLGRHAPSTTCWSRPIPSVPPPGPNA